MVSDMGANKTKKLDNPLRLVEYCFDDIVNMMDLEGGECGADVGCGTGLFSVELSKQLPNGKIYAVDVNSDLLKITKDKIQKYDIKNIEIIKSEGYKARIKKNSLDFIFLCVVLHEIDDKEIFLKEYFKRLKDGAKIFIVEFINTKRSLNGPENPKKNFIKEEDMKRIIKNSGLSLSSIRKLNELVYITTAIK